ncbi:MAG: hypothetical protein GY795_18370 [Desulfobacterales bacterium]|nr:hypothetical protein [Desulfobacterales bacterium]
MIHENITRESAIDILGCYGIEGEDVYLIDIIPLIEMIWAGGMVKDTEALLLDDYICRHVNNINTQAGYEIITVDHARAFAQQFLINRPDPEFLRKIRSLIPPVRSSVSDRAANEALRESLIAACLDIASSSSSEYPYELDERFRLAEKYCFFDILDSLEGFRTKNENYLN